MKTGMRSFAVSSASLLVMAACDNAGIDLGTAVTGKASMAVQVYLDRDGSRSFNSADTLYPGARIALRPSSGGKIVADAVSSRDGIATFDDVEYGEYLVTVEAAGLGDSLVVGSISLSQVRIRNDAPPVAVTVRLSYPEISVRQARQSPSGRRVMITGLVLAGVQSFSDTTSHLRDTSQAVRLTRASVRGGSGGSTPGDSVTVLGTVSSRAGQPTLDRAIITVFSQRPAPIPIQLTTAVAATAQGGTLDADLVRVTNATITDAGPEGVDFRVVVTDGSGPLTIILDGNTPVNPAAFPVGRVMSARGVLVPDGAGKWRLKPRDGNDITLF